jgi:hypothetical protein
MNMELTTAIITILLSTCILLFGTAAIVVGIYAILVWYPAYKQKRADIRKANGVKGEATIVRLPDFELQPFTARSAAFTLVNMGLEIRVPGIEPYEIDKVFSVPTQALYLLRKDKVVDVWVDPNEPRDLDKIVIDIKE